jgi:DNA-binding response OmpR family regulator
LKEVRVLIVDDSKVSYMMLTKMLEKTNFKVCDYAKDSKEAVEKYQIHKPDIITMDMNLPDGDGIETSRHILKLDPNAKILMISAMKDVSLMIKGRAAGIRSFLQKPVDPNEFIDTLLLLYQNEMNLHTILEESYIKPLVKIFQRELFKLSGLQGKMMFEETRDVDFDVTGTGIIIGLTGNPSGRMIIYAADITMIEFARLVLNLSDEEDLSDEEAQDAFEEAANILMGNYISKLNDLLKDNEIRITPPGMISGNKIRILNTKLKSFKITAKTRIGDLEMSIGFAGRQDEWM